MSDPQGAYILGFLSFPALIVIAFGVAWLGEKGQSLSCDRHGWSTGPTSMRRWRREMRRTLHRLRWHSFGRKPLWATDRWILDHREWCQRSRRTRRGYEMAACAGKVEG